MAEENATEMVRNITICLVAAATAGVLITIYHCITSNSVRDMLHLGRTATTTNQLHHRQQQTSSLSRQDHPRSMETSIAQLIPSYKYQKKVDDDDNENKGVVENDEGMCPVCLCNFEDGEDVRTLPDCLHSFHAPCIDMWLFSHPNCPMCRTIATPSPRMLLHLINSNPDTPPIAANMPNHYISPIDRIV